MIGGASSGLRGELAAFKSVVTTRLKIDMKVDVTGGGNLFRRGANTHDHKIT